MATAKTTNKTTKEKVEVKQEENKQPEITQEMIQAVINSQQFKDMMAQMNAVQSTSGVVDTAGEKIEKARRRITNKAVESKAYNLDRKAVVPVRKITSGSVGYITSDTNKYIVWNDKTTEHMLTIEELINMNGKSDKFLNTPWLIVDDYEFMEAFGLTELYELVFEIENLIEFYSQSMSQITLKLEKLPKQLLEQTIEKTVSMIATGELVVPNLLSIIKLLKHNYDIDIEI